LQSSRPFNLDIVEQPKKIILGKRVGFAAIVVDINFKQGNPSGLVVKVYTKVRR
jgi:hypothetical protein